MKTLQENISRIKNLMNLSEGDTEFTKDPYGDYSDGQAPIQTGPSKYGVNPNLDKKMDDYDSDGMGEGEIKEEGEETTTTSTDTTTDTTTDTSSAGATTVSKWESGRKLGSTYNGPNAKWSSNIGKGPGNKTATEKWSSGRTYGPTGKYGA
jgi:hypothetical protein